jgi:micrococcal nuclease
MWRILQTLLLLPILSTGTYATELAGPIEARVVRVIDGDTFEADALVWPGHTVRVNVRIRGIDAPELRTSCGAEKAAAVEARDVLATLLVSGSVQVRNVGADKYYGRVVADVVTGDGDDIAVEMVRLAVARSYDGGTRPAFCASLEP